MAASTIVILLTSLCCVGLAYGVSDSSGLQAIIPSSLLDCYRNMTLLTRENLPPMTLNVLLAIIRKLENQPGVYQDMRTLTSQIMNSYRMDGIEKNPDVAPSQYVTPYGPSGNQFYRYKILMDGLIPTSGSTFSNTALNNEEKCAIHLMLSASVDRSERGDESKVCNILTNYVRWDSRVPRNVRSYEEEVELVSPQHKEPAFGKWMDGGFSGLSCPLENGVVYTRYGAVKFGMVLGGVAAGLQSQSVSRRNLILVAKANSLRGRSYNFPRLYASPDSNLSISNIWAATLSGEIAETALLQGPLSSGQMRVGLNGGWNDSVLPRYYFLQEDNKDAITDTDIRGSVDGLILGTNVQSWSNQIGGSGRLKLSQLLDMYYSERGVLSTSIRACQRVTQFNSMFTPDQILQQSYAFSGVLELELPPAVNVEDAGLQNFNSIAVQKLISYVPSMTENQCSFGSTTYTNIPSTGQVTKIIKPVVNLYLVMDFSLDYLDASRIASQLAERLEVSRFTGNISVINAKDASVVVNSTSDILQFYANFTRNNYETRQRGFDLPKILLEVGNVLQNRLYLDKQYNVAGGPASVVLIVPSSSAVVNYNDNDRNYMYNRLNNLKRTVPVDDGGSMENERLLRTFAIVNMKKTDTQHFSLGFLKPLSCIAYKTMQLTDAKFMFLSSGSKDRFTSFVEDSSKDIFTLMLTDIPTSIDSVMARLKDIPRRIINPSCLSFNAWGQATSNLVLKSYIEPVGGVHYYRIHPNYFFQSANGILRISSPTGKTLNICQSRVNVLPGNNSQSDTCRQITSDTYDVYLNYACGDTPLSNCAPFYFSVAVVPSSSSNINSCTDENCRYPDNIQVDIRQDGLTCASRAVDIFCKNSILLISLVVLYQIVR